MTQTIPKSFRDLVDGPVLVVMATSMPDGQPQLSAVWCNADDTHLLVNSARRRQKERNILRDPRVTLFFLDPEQPYRFLEVRGTVEEITEHGAVEHIEELPRLYTRQPGFYGYEAPSGRRYRETRIIFRIKPERVRTS